MKNHQNKNGFAAVEFIFLVIIICLIAVTGYLVYHRHHKVSKTTTASNSVPNNWLPYKDPTEHFSVYFPKHPVTVPLGSNVTQIQSFPNASSIYTVAIVDYKNNSAPTGKDGLDNLLPVSESGYQDGKLSVSNYRNIKGIESENFTLTGVDKGYKVYVSGKIVRTNQRVYDVDAQFKNVLINSQSYAKDFVDSFKLI